MKEIKGNILILGDNIDTAQILPPQYQGVTDRAEAAKHVLEGHDCGFAAKKQQDSVLAAGSHFGRGTAPEAAAAALKAAGVRCVIAKSFAQPFFHQAVNYGLLPVVADIRNSVKDGDNVTVNPKLGKITYPGGEASFAPYPEHVRYIIEIGDLITATRRKLGKR